MKQKMAGLWAASPTSQRREPTGAEVATGFPCGPLDQQLWNELTYRLAILEAEVQSVVSAASIAPDEAQIDQLLEAINALKAAVSFNVILPGFFAARASDGSFTTIAASTWTKVTLGVEVIDREGWFSTSTSRFQPTEEGYYMMMCGASFGNGANNPTVGTRIFKNGDVATDADPTTCVWGSQAGGITSGSVSVGTGVIYFNGTSDYAELYGYQDSLDGAGVRRASKGRMSGYFLGV